MISTKKLIKLARKWQSVAGLRRKRISLRGASGDANQNTSNVHSVADKGHFVVYTVDNRRFVFPIAYLNNPIVRELFKMSEEEFGLPSDGPITFPCDVVFLEYVISLIKRHSRNDLEIALLMSMSTGHCFPIQSQHQGQSNQRSLICGF